MKKETWKAVKGHELLYQISDIGNVKSLKRNCKLLKHKTTKDGYKFITIKKQTKYIHKLVAEAFIENKKDYKQVNHKDFNKENNCIENLEWCNNRQNATHRELAKERKCNAIGVNKRGNKFRVQIRLTGGEKKWLGSFNTEQEASEAYKKELIKIEK